MTDNVTLQELFDGQSSFAPADVGMILAFQDLWSKHKLETDRDSWSAAYYNDLSEIAHKYGVDYKTPTHIAKLTEVGSPTTIH